MQQPLPSPPAFCLRISPRATISTETCHPSATSSPHQPSCAEQSPPSPVEEGLDLYLPYHKHIWRLASIKTVCAWRLPGKTALCLWAFSRLNRSGRKKKSKGEIQWQDENTYKSVGNGFWWKHYFKNKFTSKISWDKEVRQHEIICDVVPRGPWLYTKISNVVVFRPSVWIIRLDLSKALTGRVGMHSGGFFLGQTVPDHRVWILQRRYFG